MYERWLQQADEHAARMGLPLVGLCFAQSLDGSLTAVRGKPLTLSGPETRRLTHTLRAHSDAILVGLGTVLADDPSLTVRLVDGPHPQPVVLDSRLRTPITAALVSRPVRPVWIATTESADVARRAALECAGADVLILPAGSDGRVDLHALLAVLAQRGVRSLMVEGGAAVLSSFLMQDLADWVSITVAPVLIGGLHALQTPLPGLPRLLEISYQPLGDDLVVWGRLRAF